MKNELQSIPKEEDLYLYIFISTDTNEVKKLTFV